MASDKVRSSVPLQAESKYEPILVVLLGDLFGDLDTSKEMRKVADAMSRYVLTGSNHYWPVYTHIPGVEKDIFGNSSTLTDLYNISTTAKSNGWDAVMFLDELSWRQHKQIVTNREDPTLSATVVNLACEPSKVVPSPSSTFFIRRLPLVMAMEETFLAEPQKPKDWSNLGPRVSNHSFNIHMRTGFYLHCPWEPIFGDFNIAEHRENALQAKPALPQELKSHIMNYIQLPEPSCLQELIDTSGKGDTSKSIIQPLVFMTDEERTAVYDAIKAQLPDEKLLMGRWKQQSVGNRREVSRILWHFREETRSVIFVLNSPKDKKDLKLAVHKPPSGSNDDFKLGIFHKISLDSLKDEFDQATHSIQKCDKVLFDENKEVFMDPLWTFPQSIPPWFKSLPRVEISRERDAGHSDPSCLQLNKYLVFYLTKHLTKEQMRRVEDRIEEDPVGEEGFQYVPWEHETDGVPSDMLRLMKMTQKASLNGYRSEQECHLVFIDRKSGVDGKAIVCSRKLILDHGYSGLAYGRLGADFSSCLANLETANMDIDEWVDELYFFRDPDYSGPLKDEDEDDDEDEDEDME